MEWAFGTAGGRQCNQCIYTASVHPSNMDSGGAFSSFITRKANSERRGAWLGLPFFLYYHDDTNLLTVDSFFKLMLTWSAVVAVCLYIPFFSVLDEGKRKGRKRRFSRGGDCHFYSTYYYYYHSYYYNHIPFFYVPPDKRSRHR